MARSPPTDDEQSPLLSHCSATQDHGVVTGPGGGTSGEHIQPCGNYFHDTNVFEMVELDGETYDNVPKVKRQLGLFSAAFLIFNRVIGTGLLTWGLRLQNTLGLFKLVVLGLVAFSGLFALVGVPGFEVREEYEKPDNLRWEKLWEGGGTGANAFVSGLYNVIWSFIGYSNANYALSEVRDPVRTIKRAAPLAMLCVTLLYLFINVAYFAVVSKTDILDSKRIVAALYFRNLFGPVTEKAGPELFHSAVHIGKPASWSILSRPRYLIQELGREGILPYSPIFASNKPFNAPLAGLFTQYLVSCTFLLAVPPGDAYLFMISLSSYSLTLINAIVSFGLLLLYSPSYRVWEWSPPFRAPKLIILIFFLSNMFLLIVPFFPPLPGSRSYDNLPYWSHSVGGFAVSVFGVAYWAMGSRDMLFERCLCDRSSAQCNGYQILLDFPSDV
ncbi:hypothetical protein NLJ89_g3539 [Agrocybe chaxingu]|uniref:High-affinity methionine permease n=1 Tax=Agrocybe chaxingu TaxID=84603 RepID=A0A9W8K2A6_9AGAR|nr:hypothetical protein NLJ89_g3539 [Agrocybe chaxingu]